MKPADRPGQPTAAAASGPSDPTEPVIDLTDQVVAAFERIIDLRAPGAPYTYPSSPAADEDDAAPSPPPSDTGMFGVARGSADVRTAPPDY